MINSQPHSFCFWSSNYFMSLASNLCCSHLSFTVPCLFHYNILEAHLLFICICFYSVFLWLSCQVLSPFLWAPIPISMKKGLVRILFQICFHCLSLFQKTFLHFWSFEVRTEVGLCHSFSCYILHAIVCLCLFYAQFLFFWLLNDQPAIHLQPNTYCTSKLVRTFSSMNY